jgi:uncharacterized protein with HEPN domain
MSLHTLRAREYLVHMLDAVGQIQQYVSGKGSEDFLSDRLLQDGIVRNFEILGEASRNFLNAVPDAAARFNGIPFAAIYGMRNQLSHGYFAIDLDVVWKVIERIFPTFELNWNWPSQPWTRRRPTDEPASSTHPMSQSDGLPCNAQ